MEDQIGYLTAFLKGMQARIDQQHYSLKQTLEVNTSVLKDLSAWKPQVQAEVQHLKISIRDLRAKFELLSEQQAEAAKPRLGNHVSEHEVLPPELSAYSA